MGGDSVQVGDETLTELTRPHNIYIGGNTFYENDEDGIDIKRGQHIIMSGNTIYDMATGSAISTHNGADNVWVIFNKLYGSGIDKLYAGFIATSGTNVFAVGNIVYGIKHTTPDENNKMAIGGRDLASMTIVNNTIYDCDYGIDSAGSTLPVILASNNIIMNSVVADVYIYNSTAASNSDLTYSDAFTTTAGKIRWGTGSPISVAAWKSAFPTKGTGTVEVNPSFVNPTTNFTLQPGSQCANTGTLADVYATFLSTYSQSIAYDYAGTARPIGSWDMGAYESSNTPVLQGVTIIGGSIQ